MAIKYLYTIAFALYNLTSDFMITYASLADLAPNIHLNLTISF